MSKSESNSTRGGIGFFGMLTILFIGLKLTGHINWSWWWVLLPIYGPLAIVLAVVVIYFAFKIPYNAFKRAQMKRPSKYIKNK